MVLINELTVEQINAALLHLQRSKDEVVGGNKGTTIQNISVNNSGGGGNNVDYLGTIKLLAKNIETNKDAIAKNTSDIASLKDDMKNIEKSVEETLQGLADNGISDISFDTITKQLTITTNDGDTFQTVIAQDIGVLSYDSVNNKLVLTTGEQTQAITLPYILSSEKGSANGVATLDENGRVPYSQLPESTMEFLGQWDASTNTPHLADGTGTNGDFYIVSVGGTVNLGTAQDPHNVTFYVNDRIVYEGDIAQWVRLPAGQVSSVNGQSGVVVLTANDIEYSTGVSIKDKIDCNAVQSDWNVTDTTSLAYIKNKPTLCGASSRNIKTLTNVGDTNFTCAEERTCVPDMSFLAFWNGAYSSNGSSNLRYYCVGSFGSAAHCNASDFRGSTWTPSCVACAGLVYLDTYTVDCDRPIMVTSGRGTTGYTDQGVSTCCPLTFNPATGVMCRNCGEMAGFQVAISSPANTRRYILVDYGSAHGGNITAQIYNSVYSINKADSTTAVVTTGDAYGSLCYAHLGTDSSPSTCGWLSFTGWRPMTLFGRNPIKIVCNTTTAPSGVTFCSICNYRYPKMNDVSDASDVSVAQNTVCRKIIMTNNITNVGFRTRVGIGLQRGTTGWGEALLSVGTNDAGTTFYDYKFSNTGVLTAACFCGDLCGTATNACYVNRCGRSDNWSWHLLFGYANTTAASTGVYVSNGCSLTFNPATGVLSACCFSGTVSCATYAYHDAYTANYDRPIMVTSDDQTSGEGTYRTQGTVRSGCNFTYNPATGQLKLKSSGKTACISHINDSYLHIYTDAPGIAFNQDIYLPDGKYICRAKYAYCVERCPVYSATGITIYSAGFFNMYYVNICMSTVKQCDVYKGFCQLVKDAWPNTFCYTDTRWETAFIGHLSDDYTMPSGWTNARMYDIAVINMCNGGIRIYDNADDIVTYVDCASISNMQNCHTSANCLQGYFIL